MEATAKDRRLIDELKRGIADPATPPDLRAEYQEELGCITTSYVIATLLEDDEAADASRASQ